MDRSLTGFPTCAAAIQDARELMYPYFRAYLYRDQIAGCWRWTCTERPETNHTVIDWVPPPAVGSYVEPDGWRPVGALLQEGDDFAPFRLPSVGGDLAVRVEITGRRVQYLADARTVRVKIVFLGDGSPDVETGGLMYLKS